MAPPVGIYRISLDQNENSKFIITKGVYALLECSEHGIVQNNLKYQIVQHIAEDQYECSCQSEYLYDYDNSEKCHHIKAAQKIWFRFDFQNEETDTFKTSTKL